jgi:multiple sugar transport system ATP-binding protein
LIAGLERADGGDICFGDKSVTHIPAQKRDVGMVFQSYALYPHMTVFNNMAIPLKIGKVAKEEIERKIHRVAKLLQISNLLGRKPAQLSGGQRQRVALGRAIVRDPAVFLLDEPLSNLDAKLRVLMRAELIKLQKALGVTTVYVTHDQVEAMTMADRVALLDNGKIQQVATPHEMYSKPNNLFVAGFTGNPPMNLLVCKLQNEKGAVFLNFYGSRFELDDTLAKIVLKNATNSELVLGIRPEDMIVTKEKDAFISGEIDVIERLGSQIILNLGFDGSMIKAVVGSDFQCKIGDKLFLDFKRDKLRLFDKKTERTLV